MPLYLIALLAGAAIGLAVPGISTPLEKLINPVLGLLLYATFLGVPFARIGQALRDWRFLTTVVVVDFFLVPLVAFALSRVVADDQALLVGVLLVLLTPCVDYVMVFTGLAGGANDRLLAAAPILMLGQMLLLPVQLRSMVDTAVVQAIDLAPFVHAFVFLIAVPLAAAGLTQYADARWGAVHAIRQATLGAMVPLMMLTLAIVVASQIGGVGHRIGSLTLAIPLFVLFAAIMVPIGSAAGQVARLDVPGRRAVVFSGVTRNSLVVLPLALALPDEFDLAPLVVVTQTLVELVVMVVFVRLIPALIAAPGQPRSVDTPA
ncbi:arsenic resistance protein [Brooklawnia cerclae]